MKKYICFFAFLYIIFSKKDKLHGYIHVSPMEIKGHTNINEKYRSRSTGIFAIAVFSSS
jgi:hypothetical protein